MISVDTKKKELVGDFKNPGQDWRPKGSPERVRVHDFLIPEQGKAIPYGVYDLTRDEGWVSVGIDHDTAHFAVNSIRSWWQKMGALGLRWRLSAADHGGCGREQRAEDAPVEGRVAEVCQPHRPLHHRVSLPSPAPANGTRSNIGSSATSP